MGSFLYSIGGFVIAIGLLVAVHEYGHFWVARRLGVKVLRYSIGFGRPVWSRRSAVDGVEYAVGMIPLGGYVKMLDENEGEVDVSERHLAFNRQPLWVRSAIAAAGPVANFLFAVVAFWLVFILGIQGFKPIIGDVAPTSLANNDGFKAGDEIVAIDGRPNRTWSEHNFYLFNKAFSGAEIDFEVRDEGGRLRSISVDLSGVEASQIDRAFYERVLGLSLRLPSVPAIVGELTEGFPGVEAGLEPGDRILLIDDQPIASWEDMVQLIQSRPNQIVSMAIQREGERIELEITPRQVERDGKMVGMIGVANQPVEMFAKVTFGPGEAIWRSVEATWVMSVFTVRMLIKMLQLEVSVKNISGPITIAKYAGQSIQLGIDYFIWLLAVISISLGILNLLPIPVLDGGHLLFNLLEAIKGRPLSDSAMMVGQQIGLVLLAALMGLAFYNDIVRLLG